jgi:hypothetical protein
MKSTYKDFIGIYEDVFPKQYCDYLISKGNKQLQKYPNEREKASNIFAEDLSCNIMNVITENDYNFFYDNMKHIIKHYANKYRCIQNIISLGYSIADFKFQKTQPSQGYHIFHSEFEWKEQYTRRWGVWTLYLNDVEEGGETEFLYQNLRVKPKTGSVCIFPSYYTHTHRGNPPLQETKYILTGWFLYPENFETDPHKEN